MQHAIKKPSVLILTGLPYAGKTRLSQALSDRKGFVSVSTDRIIESRGYDATSMDQSQWDEVFSAGYDEMKGHLTEGRSVVVDIANLLRHERDTARSIALEHNAVPKVVYVNTPKDEIWKRWEKNAETQERGQVDKSSMDHALSMFEEPTPDETPILYNSSMDLDEWIAINIEGPTSNLEEKKLDRS